MKQYNWVYVKLENVIKWHLKRHRRLNPCHVLTHIVCCQSRMYDVCFVVTVCTSTAPEIASDIIFQSGKYSVSITSIFLIYIQFLTENVITGIVKVFISQWQDWNSDWSFQYEELQEKKQPLKLFIYYHAAISDCLFPKLQVFSLRSFWRYCWLFNAQKIILTLNKSRKKTYCMNEQQSRCTVKADHVCRQTSRYCPWGKQQ